MLTAIINILIYDLFAWIMFSLGIRSKYVPIHGRSYDHIDRYLWYYIAFFTVISGIRWSVGSDNLSYIYNLITLDIGNKEELEIIYKQFVYFISSNNIHYVFGLAALAFFQIFFLVKGILKSHARFVLAVLPIVLFGSWFFIDMMNAVRQYIASCIFIYALYFAWKRKALYYVLWIVIAALIHKSALLLLPLYFVSPKFTIAKHRIVLLLIFFACFILGFFPEKIGVNNIFASNILELLGYSTYGSNLEYYLEFEERSFGPMQLSYFLCTLATIFWGPRMQACFGRTVGCFNYWYLYAYICMCLYFLLCNINFLVLRPLILIMPCEMIIISLLIYYFGKRARISPRYGFMRFLLVITIWVSLSWNIIKNVDIEDNTVLYKTFFLHKWEPDWYRDYKQNPYKYK